MLFVGLAGFLSVEKLGVVLLAIDHERHPVDRPVVGNGEDKRDLHRGTTRIHKRLRHLNLGDLIDDFRRAGIYAAKIISGEKPGDLPIEQASKFILVFNLKTAKSLGISAPDRLLTVADEVIE